MTEHSSSPSVWPAAIDLAAGALAGSTWSLMLLGQFGRNPAGVDLLVGAIYFLLYALFWTFASWAVRITVRTLRRGQAFLVESSGPTFVALLSAYLFLLLGLYLPSHGLTWTAAIGSVVAVGVILFGSAAFSPRLGSIIPWTRWMAAFSLCLLLVVLVSAGTSSRVNSQSLYSAPTAQAPSHSALNETETHPRITLLGADGLDWVTMNHLLNEGELPNIRRFMAEGVAAPLETFDERSPLIWTSIATGVSPEVHGVQDFVWPYLRGTEVYLPHSRFDFLGKLASHVVPYREMRPFSSSDRRARAIWEIASLLNRRVLVVNWWATYPAEQVRGVVVSDYAFPSEVINREEFERFSRFERLATPPKAQNIALRTMMDFIGDRSVSVSGDPKVPPTKRNEFFVTRDELAWNVYHVLNDESFDLRLLFLNAADAPSHVYTYDVFGENVNEIRSPRVPPEKANELWDQLVLDAYRRLDVIVGQLLDDTGKREVLMLVSDHGWKYDGTSHWRRPDGVLMLRGPGILEGHRLTRAHVYDVFPTLCYLSGLPISQESEGEVVWGALDQNFVRRRSPWMIESYGQRSDDGIPFVRELDREHMERLRSLGYVQ